MLEQVAKAIHEKQYGADWSGVVTSKEWKWSKVLARAAIQAMREPTEEMVDAVNRKERQLLQGPAGARLHYSVAFRAMIDAALKTGK